MDSLNPFGTDAASPPIGGAPNMQSLRVRVNVNYFGVQLSPSEYIKEGHIALSPENLQYFKIGIGEQVYVRKMNIKYSEGMIVDEITLEGMEELLNHPRNRGEKRKITYYLPPETLLAEGGYALVSRERFGKGRNRFTPMEKVILYSDPIDRRLIPKRPRRLGNF